MIKQVYYSWVSIPVLLQERAIEFGRFIPYASAVRIMDNMLVFELERDQPAPPDKRKFKTQEVDRWAHHAWQYIFSDQDADTLRWRNYKIGFIVYFSTGGAVVHKESFTYFMTDLLFDSLYLQPPG